MSNSKKGAVVLYFMAVIFMGVSLFAKEWRVWFKYYDRNENLQGRISAKWKVLHRWNPKGYYLKDVCSKGCQDVKKSQEFDKHYDWAFIKKYNKFKLKNAELNGDDSLVIHYKVRLDRLKKVKIAGFVATVMLWFGIIAGLSLIILAFLKKIKLNKKLLLAGSTIIGGAVIFSVFMFNNLLVQFTTSFYNVADSHPISKISYGLFIAFTGPALMIVGGIIQFFDKGVAFTGKALTMEELDALGMGNSPPTENDLPEDENSSEIKTEDVNSNEEQNH